jgi:hypothetical protein
LGTAPQVADRQAHTAQRIDKARLPLSASATKNWAPGTTTRISTTAAPPPAGTYSVRLAIPDPHAPNRIPYAVKLASLRDGVNVFDGATGENKLGVSDTVL